MLTSSDWWHHSVGGSLFKIGLIINRSVDARAAFWDVCVLAAPHGGKTTIWLGWNHNSVSKFHQMSGLIIQCLAVQLHLTTVCTSPSYWPLRVFYLKSNAGCCLVSSCHLCRLFKSRISHYHCSIITSYLDDIKASRFYNLERYRFHGFPKKPPNCLSSLACTGQNQCRMQRELVEEKGEKKKEKKRALAPEQRRSMLGCAGWAGEQCIETLGHCSLAGGLCQCWLSTTGSSFCLLNLAGEGLYDGTAPQGICVING